MPDTRSSRTPEEEKSAAYREGWRLPRAWFLPGGVVSRGPPQAPSEEYRGEPYHTHRNKHGDAPSRAYQLGASLLLPPPPPLPFSPQSRRRRRRPEGGRTRRCSYRRFPSPTATQRSSARAAPSCIAAVARGARARARASAQSGSFLRIKGARRTTYREEPGGDATGEVFLIRRRFGTETHRGIGERRSAAAAAAWLQQMRCCGRQRRPMGMS